MSCIVWAGLIQGQDRSRLGFRPDYHVEWSGEGGLDVAKRLGETAAASAISTC
jgi:hypothetical protein